MLAWLLAACGAPEPIDAACSLPRFEKVASFGALELTGKPAREDWFNRGPGFGLTDLDRDGDLDLFVALADAPSLVFENDGRGGFARAQATADASELPTGLGVAIADLDGDEWADIVLARGRNDDDLVLHGGEGFRFRASPLPESRGESRSPSLGDADGDGDLDLYIAGFVPIPDPERIRQGKDPSDGGRFYWNEDGAFVAEAALDPSISRGFGWQGAWLDADDDGDADLYVANDYGNDVEPNALLLNEGGALRRAEDCFCDVGTNAMGAAVGDADGDGRIDLFLTDIGRAILLSGASDGRFLDRTAVAGVIPGRDNVGFGWGALVTDLDLDGWSDIVTTYGAPWPGESKPGSEEDTLALGLPDGTFRSLGGFDSGTSRTAMVGDLDRDGRPELLIGGLTYLDVWKVEGGCPRGITLALSGAPPDRQALGARVDVTLDDGRRYTRWNWPSVTNGQSASEVVVGLGGAKSADLRIVWPDGAVSFLESVGPGHLVAVE
jgi:enediyne biosynthesis protein E4